jgi:hypothetical protein
MFVTAAAEEAGALTPALEAVVGAADDAAGALALEVAAAVVDEPAVALAVGLGVVAATLELLEHAEASRPAAAIKPMSLPFMRSPQSQLAPPVGHCGGCRRRRVHAVICLR